MSRVDVFLDEVPEYAVREGIVYISTADGWTCAFPLRKFRLGMARAAKAIAEYEARNAEVVPIKGGHAARS